jgi:hypothetical protein
VRLRDIQRPADGLDDERSLAERGDDLFVDDHVQVAIAVPCLDVSQAMVFVWQRKQCFGEHGP